MELPMLVTEAALTFEHTDRYNLTARYDWTSLAPAGGSGWAYLGPEERVFGVSFSHQFHCLDATRRGGLHVRRARLDTQNLRQCLFRKSTWHIHGPLFCLNPFVFLIGFCSLIHC